MIELAQASVEEIAFQLRTLGVHEGGTLLVHSSLRSLGHVPGGAETVIRGLLAALGDGGTLLMPGLSYMAVGSRQTRFDLRSTPSCVGVIPETFRVRAGTIRSLHPTHSVCGVGPRADALLDGHDQDMTPVGPRSPFRRLRDVDGQLLMLGCGLRPNTSMHGVEELVEPPYLFRPGRVRFELTDAEGRIIHVEHRVHDFAGRTQRYDRLAPLMPGDALREGRVLEAACQLLDARTMWEIGLAALERDPLAFVEPTRV